jgi:hypothetical protein
MRKGGPGRVDRIEIQFALDGAHVKSVCRRGVKKRTTEDEDSQEGSDD